jgi:rhodanese-related sulfurtransferase
MVSDLTEDKLARMLFHSLRDRIIPLPDNVIVYPAHGAGSACGKNMSKETFDTLGNQKQSNYALNLKLTEDDFVKEITDGLMPPPAYFPKNVSMNIKGYDSIDTVLSRGLDALSVEEFIQRGDEHHALILDTRKPTEYVLGSIPGSVSIGLDGQFAVWVGTLITDIKHPILLVTDTGREEEAVTRLSRVGYDQTIGYLEGGFESWKKAGQDIQTITSVSAEEAADILEADQFPVVDVRKKSEFDSEHVLNALNTPLDYINDSMTKLDKNQTYLVHCAGGYRSVIFASILKARGYHNLIDIKGGFNAIKNSGKYSLTEYVCPSTLL